MSYRLELEIRGLPKTTNGHARAHWRRLKAEADLWKNRVWGEVFVKKLAKPSKPLKHAKLTLTRHSSTCPDADGLVSSWKHVIDGLVKCGILEDDGFENIGMPDYRWEKVPKNEGKIRVVVEEQAP